MINLASHKTKTIQAHNQYMSALNDSIQDIESITFSIRDRQSHCQLSPQFAEIESLYLWLAGEPSVVSELDTKHSIARDVFLK